MNKKKNGVVDIDTEQMTEMRKTVVEQELSARSWKAFYEKMYYSLEAEKIEPAYKEYQERTRQRLEDEQKRMEEYMKSLQAEVDAKNEADPVKNLTLQAVE